MYEFICSLENKVIRNVRDFHPMANFLSPPLLMALLRFVHKRIK